MRTRRSTFEDQLTMQYQVQEMLRIERIFEAEASRKNWMSITRLSRRV